MSAAVFSVAVFSVFDELYPVVFNYRVRQNIACHRVHIGGGLLRVGAVPQRDLKELSLPDLGNILEAQSVQRRSDGLALGVENGRFGRHVDTRFHIVPIVGNLSGFAYAVHWFWYGLGLISGRMKITDVEVLVLKSPGLYRSPEADEEAIGPTYMGLMKVSTDAGLTGWSAMETSATVAKAAVEAPQWSEPGMECFEGLRALLVGENPLEIERLWYKMYRGSIYYGRRGVAIQAISAIDIALWDICGKYYKQPVSIIMGARWRDRVRAYASTLFRPTPEGMRLATRRYLDQGFTAIKFGWGVFGEDPRRDVELAAAARREMGDRNDLLIDTGWFVERTPKQAIQVVRSLEPYRPFFIEEILHPEDYDGYRNVAEAVDTPIACGEQEATDWGFRELIERARVDILQPDLTRCGGLTIARKIVHMAELANVHVIPHSWSSDLLTAASLHLNAFQRRALLIEFNTASGPLSRNLARNPLQLEGGFLRVPDGPGLGVEVDEETIRQYRIA